MSALKTLQRIGLADWPAISVGLRRNWVSVDDVVDLAAQFVANDPSGSSEPLAILAGLNSQAGSLEVQSLIDELAEYRNAGEAQDKATDAWRLAFLLDATRDALDGEDLIERAQVIFGVFGYPDDMVAVSPFGPAPLDEMGHPISPLEAIHNVVDLLRQRLIEHR